MSFRLACLWLVAVNAAFAAAPTPPAPAAPVASKPLAGYLYSREVAWGRYHDPMVFALADGVEMKADLNGWKWEQVNAWPKGKKLFLCYDETRGATLLDPATGRWLVIRHIWDSQRRFAHPIDAHIASLPSDTTLDMINAAQEAQRLWRLEIDRSVKEVLALPHLPKDVRDGFVALAKQRLDYCQAQVAFASAAIHADITGTAAGPMTGDYAASVYRDAFEHLAKVADSYVAFRKPPEER